MKKADINEKGDEKKEGEESMFAQQCSCKSAFLRSHSVRAGRLLSMVFTRPSRDCERHSRVLANDAEELGPCRGHDSGKDI